ncbi:RNA-binding ATPase activator esf2 [Ascosphaera pollenicola]|nr:RNA-binding ATPase activator esf2 [Ascosphaera pollenicola]
MSVRKRNEFLDLESEDESDRGYDSEAAEESKGRITSHKRSDGQSPKRRRLSDDQSDYDSQNSDVEGSDDEGYDSEEHLKKGRQSVPATATQDERDDKSTETKEAMKTKKKEEKDRLKAEAKKLKEKKDKTGVIYLSSLPPYLKPSALKTLLIQRGFGPITRVFLTPANPPSGSAGRKSNKRKTYADGWVEFASKKVAKICAQTLNATIVGGKKGGWYHDDIWNMKYLKGFKWADLMEQIQRERSEREAKRRIEDARAKKEEKMFLAGVEKGKVVEGIRKKKEEKGEAPQVDVRRVFRQNKVVADDERTIAQVEAPKPRKLDDNAKKVLSQIF